MTGVDVLVDRVVSKLPDLAQVWICGDLARGIQSDNIECVAVGKDLDKSYITTLCVRVEELTGKTVNAQVTIGMHPERIDKCLLVWERNT